MKSFHFKWKTAPLKGSVYWWGGVTVEANSFDEAIDEAERLIRAKNKVGHKMPLKIVEQGEEL